MGDFKLMFDDGVVAYTDIDEAETAQDVQELLEAHRAGRNGWMSLGAVCFWRQRLIAVEEHITEDEDE